MEPVTLHTPRLLLRPWREEDRGPFSALCGEPEMMEYLTPLRTRDASDAWIDRQRARFDADGFGMWAVECRDEPGLLGAIGVVYVPYEAHFTPAIEVGWRIGRASWGRGYATEAAAASLRFGFERLSAPEIVANAAVANVRSQAVMRRLGMTRSPADDFDHPRLAEGDPLRRQVLYRLSRAAWQAAPPDRRQETPA